MTLIRLAEAPPVLLVAVSAPFIVWSWGRAIEQLAVALCRLQEVRRQKSGYTVRGANDR